MQNQIVKKSENHIRQLFAKKLTKDHRFHDLAHTLSVQKFAKLLGEMQNKSKTEIEILELTALFHDSGYTEVYQGHEKKSCQMAQDFLGKNNYPADQIKTIIHCIEATYLEYVPVTDLQKITKDADLNNIGQNTFFEHNQNLRHEWEVLCNKKYSDLEWYKNNLAFLESHQFFTEEAKTMWKKGKKKNLKKTKALLKMAQAKFTKEKTPIEGSKSTQMMFKTALRNHIDLTGIADNKANMMLSINALIITIAMPLLAANIDTYRYLLLPSAILLLTCILSVIFATMATRPGKMMGNINMESLKKGNSNVFFFGNFHKMSLDNYRDAVDVVVKDEIILEKSIVNDLYFLGRALGTKYSQLRTCYLIFMIGMTTTVLAFVFSFMRTM